MYKDTIKYKNILHDQEQQKKKLKLQGYRKTRNEPVKLLNTGVSKTRNVTYHPLFISGSHLFRRRFNLFTVVGGVSPSLKAAVSFPLNVNAGLSQVSTIMGKIKPTS